MLKRILIAGLILAGLCAPAHALQKNVASQKWAVFAFDATDNTPKTGDAAQISGVVWIDGVTNTLDDTNPTEKAHGIYVFDLAQAETNGNYVCIDVTSSTSDIQVVGMPACVWTMPANISTFSIDSNGRVDMIKIAGTTQTANDNGADINDILTDTAAVDTANEIRTLLTGGTSALSILTTSDNIGINWADVSNPTTAVNLSGTNIKTDQVVASVSGAVGSVTGAVGSVTGNIGGNIGGTVPDSSGTTTLLSRLSSDRAGYLDYINTIYGKLPTNYIMGSSGQTDKDDDIDAILTDTAEIGAAGAGLTAVPWNASWDAEVQSEATDALNAYDPPTNTEMTSAFTEIKGATWASTDTLEAIRDRGDAAWGTADVSGLATAANLAVVDGIVDSILEDTGTTLAGDLSTIDGIVDSILEDTGTALPATLATIDGIVDDILVDTGTDIPAAISGLNDISAGDVWDVTLSEHTGAGSTGYALNAAGAAGDPWSTALPGAYGAGSAGYILGTYLDEAISGIDDNPWDDVTRTLTSGGYSGLTSGDIDNIWDELVSGHTTASSFAKLLTDYLDAAVTSRLASASYTAPDNASITEILTDTGTTLPGSLSTISGKIDTAQADLDNPSQYKATGFSTHSAADVWAVGTRALTDKSGFSLSSAAIDSIWDEVITGHSTADSFGKVFDDQINGLRTYGDSGWATAVGFSTHAAADVVTAMQAVAGDFKADVSGMATSANQTTIIGHLTDIKGATWDSLTDSLEAIRDRGDAAWITGGAGSAPTVEEIRAEMDSHSTVLAAILEDTGTTVPGLIGALNDVSIADFFAEDSGHTYSEAVAGSVVKEIGDNAGGGTTVY